MPLAVKINARETLVLEWATKKFKGQCKSGPGAPDASMLLSAIGILGKFVARPGRALAGLIGAESNEALHGEGCAQLVAELLWILALERIFKFLRDEGLSTSSPGFGPAKAEEARKKKMEQLILRLSMGRLKPKHERMMGAWSKETDEYKMSPSPTLTAPSSAASAPKSMHDGKSKPSGAARFAHCIKF